VARPERFELPTFWFVARRSIQLSYGRAERKKFNTRERCTEVPKAALQGPQTRFSWSREPLAPGPADSNRARSNRRETSAVDERSARSDWTEKRMRQKIEQAGTGKKKSRVRWGRRTRGGGERDSGPENRMGAETSSSSAGRTARHPRRVDTR
jgi:hypothetical protein